MSSIYATTLAVLLCFYSYKAFNFVREITQKAHKHIPNVLRKRSERAKVVLKFPEDAYFKNKDGLYIFWRRWLPKGEVKGVLTVVHGLWEHCGRYDHVARAFNSIGVAVYALDHQGHGRSEGDRYYSKSIDDLVDDVMHLSLKAKKLHPKAKNFILGHSMGGAIATVATIKNQSMFDAAIYSSPGLYFDPNENPEMLIQFGRLVNKIFPKLRIKSPSIETLVRNKQAFDAYINDPLVGSHITPTVGLQVSVLDGINIFNQRANELKLPIMLIHGTSDAIVPVEASRLMKKFASSKDLICKEYEGGYHELLNEKDNTALEDIVSWLKNHL